MNSLIQTGDTETITLDVRDASGAPFTGASDVRVRVRRDSDGLYLDWDDLTFKGAGWVERDRDCVEADAVLAAGLYEVPGGFPTLSITNLSVDDFYLMIPAKGPAADTAAAVLPTPGELKVGFWADAVGLELVCSATIGSLTPDTLRLTAWLVRTGVPVTSGLVSATIALEDSTGVVVVADGAMTGPTSRGIFRRDAAGVTLADATNYVSIVTITDARGLVTRFQAQPTIG